MKKVLPLVNPPIETYQSNSFILAILLAYENTACIYYNNYINLICNNTYNTFDIKLNFMATAWEDYRQLGIAEMNLYYLKNISQNKFVDFIKERIDQDNYIISYSVDEYYLSYSQNYMKKHFIHDTYIYGYEEECFCIMAYSDKHLGRHKIAVQEYLLGMYNQDRNMESVSFCTFRPNHAVKIDIDFPKMRKEFHNYLYPQYSATEVSSKAYGIDIYAVLKKSIQNYLKYIDLSEEYPAIDIRSFRMLWEHKAVLRDHIVKISELMPVDQMILTQINEVENKAQKVFRVMIKYTIKKNILYLSRVVDYLDTIKLMEEEVLSSLLNRFPCSGDNGKGGTSGGGVPETGRISV